MRFIKKYKYVLVFVILVIGGIVFFMMRGGDKTVAESVDAVRSIVAQEVTVTGRVVAAEEVELAIQSGGKVTAITVEVGDEVTAGQTLLSVDAADLQIQLGRQRSELEKVKLTHSKELPGAENAARDLIQAHEDGFNAVVNTFLDIPSIISGLKDILGQDYLSRNTIQLRHGDTARDLRDATESWYYDAKNMYDEVLKQYKEVTRESEDVVIEELILQTYEATKVIADAVKVANNFVDYIENKTEPEYRSAQLSADQESLDAYTEETNSHVSELLEIKDTIKVSREIIFNKTSDTESSALDIRQAELDIQDTLSQIAHRTIKSPIAGVVTEIEVEVGETISQGTPVIKVISANQYEIEANIPEADTAKVRMGADVDVTLDAYGSDVIFAAKVISINPAETLIDGVATYRTKFQFVENDERVKPGMTANLIIKGDYRENVIVVPQRAVITKDGGKYVRVLEGEIITEKKVETGLRGSDGNIEIVSGITEGEKIVVFSEK